MNKQAVGRWLPVTNYNYHSLDCLVLGGDSDISVAVRIVCRQEFLRGKQVTGKQGKKGRVAIVHFLSKSRFYSGKSSFWQPCFPQQESKLVYHPRINPSHWFIGRVFFIVFLMEQGPPESVKTHYIVTIQESSCNDRYLAKHFCGPHPPTDNLFKSQTSWLLKSRSEYWFEGLSKTSQLLTFIFANDFSRLYCSSWHYSL